MNNRAFIIGNGTSRKNFDLNELIGQGTIFGCNALYRNFDPDYLVVIDDTMKEEILRSDFPNSKVIIPPFDEQFEPAQFNPARPRSNAGMNAMIEAIRMGYTKLYCLGFDFLFDDNRSVSNMYEGTNAYGPETRASFVDTIGRVKYFDWFARQNNAVEFFFIFPSDQDLNLRTLEADNVYGMLDSGLLEMLGKGQKFP